MTITRYHVRSLKSGDFVFLAEMEREIFASQAEETLCRHYLRLVCDFFPDTCFIAFAGEKPVAYLLAFAKEREIYCTTLAIRPEYQRTRVVALLLKSFVRTIVDRADVCWFTVKEDNQAARALHKMLGAVEVETRPDFYGPGEARIVSRIDRHQFEALRARYERLGFVDPGPVAVEDAA